MDRTLRERGITSIMISHKLNEVNRVADKVTVIPNAVGVDIGCGLGGPARYIAKRFQCSVSGVDITERRQVETTSGHNAIRSQHIRCQQQRSVEAA